jgi:CHAD domain-containing protein
MGPRFYFELPADWKYDDLYNGLQQKFSLQSMAGQRGLFRYYDSFDWRLHLNRLILVWDGTYLFLMTADSGSKEISCRCDQEPGFAQDLPAAAGLLRDKLISIIEFRALIQVIAIKKDARAFKILDQEDKTVCYGFYERNRVSAAGAWKRLKPVFSLVPLKGYLKWIDYLVEWLQSNGGQQIKCDIYYQALEKVRISPGRYTTKVTGPLSGEISMQKAVQLILQQQLTVAGINEAGIRKDIDTEFLHDFRVAIRRIRSLLGNFQEFMTESVYRRARADFSFLIKLTNSRRDLDIFLHKQPVCLQVLPPRYRRVIIPFFDDLKRRRDKEQKKILQYLTSAEYQKNKKYWNDLVQKTSALLRRAGPGSVKIQEIAEQIIFNRYEKVVQFNRNLPAVLSDEYLHRLRIECKKLRYVLEFFQSLFNIKPVKSLVKKLRELQDTLGEYNDLRLQQNRLKTYINVQTRRGRTSSDLSGAINFLVTRIQQRKNELQLIFREQFADFCQPLRQRQLSDIFHGTKKL